MSSQRGNALKKKSQKHKNTTVFKNDLHDTSQKMKKINSLEHYGVCARCKDIVDWKIKYKKYKPLTIPKKCVKCLDKKVLSAYYIVCQDCCESLKVCSKCSKPTDDLEFGESEKEARQKEIEFQQELKLLSERQRRKFMRLFEKGLLTKENLVDNSGEFKIHDESDDEDYSDDVDSDEGDQNAKKNEQDNSNKGETSEIESDSDFRNEYEDELNEEESF